MYKHLLFSHLLEQALKQDGTEFFPNKVQKEVTMICRKLQCTKNLLTKSGTVYPCELINRFSKNCAWAIVHEYVQKQIHMQ